MRKKSLFACKVAVLVLALALLFPAWESLTSPVLAAETGEGYTLAKQSARKYTLTMEGMNRDTPLSLADLPEGSTVQIQLTGENFITVSDVLGKGPHEWYDGEIVSAKGLDAEGLNLEVSGTGSLTVRTDGVPAGAADVNQAICCESFAMSGGRVYASSGPANIESTAIHAGYGEDEHFTFSGGTLEAYASGGGKGSVYGVSAHIMSITGGTVTVGASQGSDWVYGLMCEDYEQTGGVVSVKEGGGVKGYNVHLSGSAVLKSESRREKESTLENLRVSGQAKMEMADGWWGGEMLVEDQADVRVIQAIHPVSLSYGKGLTVTGGSLTVTMCPDITGYGGLFLKEADAVRITGGTVYLEHTADFGIGLCSMEAIDLIVEGGSLTVKGNPWAIGIEGELTVSGGSLTAIGADSNNYSAGIYSRNLHIQVSGGTLTATGGVCSAYPDYPKAGDCTYGSYGILLEENRTCTVEITGGTVKATSQGDGGGADICAWGVSAAKGTLSAPDIYLLSSRKHITPDQAPAALEALPETIEGREDGFSWTFTPKTGRLYTLSEDGLPPDDRSVVKRLNEMGYQINTCSYGTMEYKYPGYGEPLPQTGSFSGEWSGFPWIYNAASQTLTINGEGAMPSYFGEPVTLAQYVFGAKNLVIGNGVTDLPDYLYYCLPQLSSLEIGNALERFPTTYVELEGVLSVAEANPNLALYDQCLYTKNHQRILLIPQGRDSIQFAPDLKVIPTGVLDGLRAGPLVLPWGLTTLESHALSYTHAGLIVLPDTLTNVADGALVTAHEIYTAFLYSENHPLKGTLTEQSGKNEMPSRISSGEVAKYYPNVPEAQDPGPASQPEPSAPGSTPAESAPESAPPDQSSKPVSESESSAPAQSGENASEAESSGASQEDSSMEESSQEESAAESSGGSSAEVKSAESELPSLPTLEKKGSGKALWVVLAVVAVAAGGAGLAILVRKRRK